MPELPDAAGGPRAKQASVMGTEEGWGNSHFFLVIHAWIDLRGEVKEILSEKWPIICRSSKESH